jgi:hypothetical protein
VFSLGFSGCRRETWPRCLERSKDVRRGLAWGWFSLDFSLGFTWPRCLERSIGDASLLRRLRDIYVSLATELGSAGFSLVFSLKFSSSTLAAVYRSRSAGFSLGLSLG